MTKSIEEQAEEYYKKSGWAPTENAVMNFIAGAKARDEQWSAVVNELREALKFTIEESGTSTNYNLKCRNSITKADQMLKEMWVSNG